MLSVTRASKKFGSLLALKELSVNFLPGEVHAVIGENGAGKSTLMNILGGFLSPTTGTIALDGKDLPSGNPQRTRSLGIEMIHQHFKLVPA
ncbi:MAG: ATP-binding cassette domain-containing protein, partial [Armatimonadota bacterium]